MLRCGKGDGITASSLRSEPAGAGEEGARAVAARLAVAEAVSLVWTGGAGGSEPRSGRGGVPVGSPQASRRTWDFFEDLVSLMLEGYAARVLQALRILEENSLLRSSIVN